MDRTVFFRPVYGSHAYLKAASPVRRVPPEDRRAVLTLPPVVSSSKELNCLMTESAVTSTISITVNGEERNVSPRYPLTDLLQDLDIDPAEASGIAVAINESVIRQTDWEDVTLANDDTVEVITAQQGG